MQSTIPARLTSKSAHEFKVGKQHGRHVMLTDLESMIILAALEAYRTLPARRNDADVTKLCARFEGFAGFTTDDGTKEIRP